MSAPVSPCSAAADALRTGPGAGESAVHDSARLHVSGRAHYADDLPLPANTLHAAFGISPVAHGQLQRIDLQPVRSSPGVVCVVSAADIPGHNNYGGIVHDDPVFADALLQYAGQPIFAVAATSHDAARRAATRAVYQIESRPALLDVRAALAAQSFVIPSQRLRRGEPEAALAAAPHRLQGSVEMGGQDHFYLEGQIAIAVPQDDGGMLIHSSTQHPTEVQHVVAEVLGWPQARITVSCRRIGGGFGGKESQPALIAAAAAVLALRSGRPVKLRLDRDADMLITGKRHDFVADYDVGYDSSGRIHALQLMLASRCGYSADLSGPVNSRAICHIDNAYYLEHLDLVSHRCKTHTVSNTAFRGFGGPQGMVVIEQIVDDIARRLGLDPLDVRQRNYYGVDERNQTHYGQQITDNVLQPLTDQLVASSDYHARRQRIAAFNAQQPVIRRGLACTPVKFGISFNATHFNQAGALLQIYTDGSVLLNHGGTEMGQGLHTKVAQVVASELGLPLDAIRISATDTSKVPNTSATAASSGADLNAKAAQAAAVTLRERLTAWICSVRQDLRPEQVSFADGHVQLGAERMAFAELVRRAYLARIQLSATGYYFTPKIHWDARQLRGRPFYYYAYGAAVCEVAVDTLTGEWQLLQADLLHDAGRSLNPAIDIGQVEGAFLQGMGWLGCEQLWWDAQGQLKTHAPSTYKIPSARDWPVRATVRLLEHNDNREDSIYRSKAVGEPPLMLAIAVLHALRDAVAACGDGSRLPQLRAPATPEAVLEAIERQRLRPAAAADR